MIHAVWVINKAGGLVFNRSYSDVLPPLPLNAVLILAGTLHGIHAITGRLDPTTNSKSRSGPSSGQGMEAFEAEGWGGRVWLSGTGTKFIVLHSIPHSGLDELLRRIYEIYADAVMKNPFHTPEMPINSSLFETRLQTLIAGVNT
ncbi:Sybindin-like protein [Dioszegia hungarica]|uniref:Trafficking protein particle complex subunit n=1 Tax=Dioszegia hungarica TaxID=4972 RepID=A0AA38LV67_9TREE|nr:Sybindin-like protein [Dioszegia hungarica]KAI9635354.1 Sybindin-like protein [Dioszegia hungarica]